MTSDETCDFTFRNEVLNGIRFDVLKAALREYSRRDEPKLGLAVLGFLERNLTDRPEIRAKGMRTSIVNRIVRMMSEDISACEPWLPVYMKHEYTRFIAAKTTRAATCRVFHMYSAVLSSRKSAVIGDIRAKFGLPPVSQRSAARSDDYRVALQSVDLCIAAANRDGVFRAIGDLLSGQILPEPNKWESLWNAVLRYTPDDSPLFRPINALHWFWNNVRYERESYLYHAALLLVVNAPDAVPRNFRPTRCHISQYLGASQPKIADYVIECAFGWSDIVISAEDARYVNPDEREMHRASNVSTYIPRFASIAEALNRPRITAPAEIAALLSPDTATIRHISGPFRDICAISALTLPHRINAIESSLTGSGNVHALDAIRVFMTGPEIYLELPIITPDTVTPVTADVARAIVQHLYAAYLVGATGEITLCGGRRSFVSKPKRGDFGLKRRSDTLLQGLSAELRQLCEPRVHEVKLLTRAAQLPRDFGDVPAILARAAAYAKMQ